MPTIRGVNFTGRKGIEDPQQSRWRGITMPFTRRPGGAFGSRGTRDVVWSSILNILTTPIGSRLMLPEFGSRLPELVFEPNDDLLMQVIRTYVFDAVDRWEPRVRMIRVDAFRDQYNEQRVHLAMAYEISNEGIVDERSTVISLSTQLAVERTT